jgi:hypothetical protein
LPRQRCVPVSYFPPQVSSHVDITDGTRPAGGYVGLRNLGATCYMNSLLQQWFMIPVSSSLPSSCALDLPPLFSR